MTLSNSEANLVIKDLTDYQILLKLYDIQKVELNILEERAKESSMAIKNLEEKLLLHQQKVIELTAKLAATEEKAKQLKQKLTGRTITGGLIITALTAILILL